jgi:hypothetical protein
MSDKDSGLVNTFAACNAIDIDEYEPKTIKLKKRNNKISAKKLVNDVYAEQQALSKLLIFQSKAAVKASAECAPDKLAELFVAQSKVFAAVAKCSASVSAKLKFALSQIPKKITKEKKSLIAPYKVRVYGKLIDKNGYAAAGVKVMFLGAKTQLTRTDSAGKYEFDNVDTYGEFSVRVCVASNALTHSVTNATLPEYQVNLILP